METEPRIAEGLLNIRRARRRVLLLLLSLLPVSVLLAETAGSDRAVSCWVVLWAMLFVVALFRLGLSECPRCGNWYHAKCRGFLGRYGNAFTRKCLNCGLSITADRQRRRRPDGTGTDVPADEVRAE